MLAGRGYSERVRVAAYIQRSVLVHIVGLPELGLITTITPCISGRLMHKTHGGTRGRVQLVHFWTVVIGVVSSSRTTNIIQLYIFRKLLGLRIRYYKFSNCKQLYYLKCNLHSASVLVIMKKLCIDST